MLAVAVVSAKDAHPVEQRENRSNHGRDVGESRSVENAAHRAAFLSLHDAEAEQLLFRPSTRVVFHWECDKLKSGCNAINDDRQKRHLQKSDDDANEKEDSGGV